MTDTSLTEVPLTEEEKRKLIRNYWIMRTIEFSAFFAVPILRYAPHRVPSFLNVVSVESALAIWKHPLLWVIILTQIFQVGVLWRQWRHEPRAEHFKVVPVSVIGNLAVGILAAVKEEIIMRWGIFTILCFLLSFLPIPPTWNYIITLVMTSVLFAYLHMQLTGLLRIRSGLAGALFAIIMMHQGTFLAAVVAHAVGNATATVAGTFGSFIRYRQLTQGGIYGN